jgi:hypothetical protein
MHLMAVGSGMVIRCWFTALPLEGCWVGVVRVQKGMGKLFKGHVSQHWVRTAQHRIVDASRQTRA